ncbi:MAG: DUF1080 domain-containing protein [Planctomycetaceae bacterium]|nr:DUF1080 domain-containing protein [Planctomycetaceae bacterium]
MLTRCSRMVGLWMVLCASVLRAADDAEAPIAPTEEIRLFDGTLDAFYTWMKDTQYEDPRDVFRITDGMIHVTGDGLGGLVTKKSYRDYHCVLEFKWGERTWNNRVTATRDSGLLVHSIGPDGAYGGIWKHSIEVQIIEGGCGDFILVNSQSQDPVMPMTMTAEAARDRDGEIVWHKGGTRETLHAGRINWYGRDPDWEDTINFRGDEDIESPFGEWTRFDVFCDGATITTYVNGVLVNQGFDADPSAGQLQLQTEQAELFVRRWELWPLKGGPEPAAAVQ